MSVLRNVVLVAGLLLGAVAGAGGTKNERAECKKSCQEVETDCVEACIEYKATTPGNCKNVCKQGTQACEKDCDRPPRQRE